MPKYKVTLDNGRKYDVDAPDPDTAWIWANRYYEDQEALKAKRPGFFGSAGTGLERATLGGIRGAQMTAQPENVELEQKLLEDKGPRYSVGEIESALKRGEYGQALKEGFGLAKQTTGESLGFMAPGMALGTTFAAAAPPVLPFVGPLSKPIAGAIGTVAGLLPGTYGANVERQAYERETARQAGAPVPEWQFGKAAGTAVTQSALDLVFLRAAGLLARGRASNPEEAMRIATQDLAKEGLVKASAVGAGKATLSEIPVEIGQSALERWQAGLPITGEAATKEYIETGITSMFGAPAFGAVGRNLEARQARNVIAAQERELRNQQTQAEAKRAAEAKARRDAVEAVQVGGQYPLPGVGFTGFTGPLSPPVPETATAPDPVRDRVDTAVREAQQRGVSVDTVIAEQRANSFNKYMNMENELNSLIARKDFTAASALKARLFDEQENLNLWGGFTPGQVSDTKAKLEGAVKKLQGLQEKQVRAVSREESAKYAEQIRAQQAEVDALSDRLSAMEQGNAVPSTKAGGAQLELDLDRNEQEIRIRNAVQRGQKYSLSEDEINALGIPKNARQLRKPLSEDLTDPAGRAIVKEFLESNQTDKEANQVARTRLLTALNRIDEQIARDKAKAQAVPETEVPVQVEEAAPAQADMFAEPTVEPTVESEGLTEAELRAQEEEQAYQQFMAEDARRRQRDPRFMPKQQQLERQRFEAERAAARQAPVDEEIAAQTEAMWAAQGKQEFEFAPPGTQFELTAPGSMPVRSQQRLAEEAPLPLRELLADYRQAMDESDLETANAVNLIGKKKYPGKWGKLRNEDDKRAAALRASQMNLDFEGAPSETQAEPVPGDQEPGRGAAPQRPASEPSVAMAEQPDIEQEAEIPGEARPGLVGGAERPAGRRDEVEKSKRSALEEKPSAVQEPSTEKVPARKRAEAGKRVGEEVPREKPVAEEGKAEEEIDPAKLLEDLRAISKREGNSEIGKEARRLVQGEDIKAARAFADENATPAPKKVGPKAEAKPAPEAPAQKSNAEQIKELEAKWQAEMDREDGARPAVVNALENRIAALQRGAGEVSAETKRDFEEAVDTDEEFVPVGDKTEVTPPVETIGDEWKPAKPKQDKPKQDKPKQVVPKQAPVTISKPVINGTSEQLDIAERLAKDIGGEIVYQNGDLALVRGYSVLSGQPVYAGIKGGARTRVDIESFTGGGFTVGEKAELVAAKRTIEAEAAALHEAKPSVTFNDQGLAFSENVPPQVKGIIAGWKRLLGLDANVYVATMDDVRANKNKYTGPMRAVGSAVLDATERGSTRMLPDGSHYIVYDPSTSKTRTLEVLAHEMGHIHEKEVFRNADEATREELFAAHGKWLAAQKGKTARELVTALRAKTTGRTTAVLEGMTAAQMAGYWKSFAEWYADQTSRWAMAAEAPQSVVEKFFARLGVALKRFYSAVKNAGYLPDQTFTNFLESISKSVKRGAKVDTSASQMVSAVKPTPGAASNAKKAALDTVTAIGRSVAPPETETYAQKAERWMGSAKEMTPAKALESYTTFADKVRTKIFSSNTALMSAFRNKMDAMGKDSKEVIGTMIAMSDSQALHDEAIAHQFLLLGNAKFDKETSKYVAEESDSNFVNLHNAVDEVASKYGFTKTETDAILQSAFEARRMDAIRKSQLSQKKQADDLRASAKALFADKSGTEADRMRRRKQAESYRKTADKLEAESKRIYLHMDEDQVRQAMTLFDTVPELDAVVNQWDGIRKNAIAFLTETSVYSKEQAESYLDSVGYVPFYRDEESFSKAGGPGNILRTLQVQKEKRMRGSNLPVHDIVDNMARWTQLAVSRGVRNAQAIRMVDFATQNMEEGFVQRTDKPSESTARVVRDGQYVYYDFKDPLYADAFKGLEQFGIQWPKFAVGAANFLRQSVVLNPMFSLGQVAQDAYGAMFTSGLSWNKALKVPVYAAREFVKTVRGKSKLQQELKKYGVVGVADFSAAITRSDAEVTAGFKSLSRGQKLMRGLQNISMASDNAIRQAVYDLALQQGFTKAEALEKAFEIINFRRTGTSSKIRSAAQLVPFMNAYFQAMNVAYKTVTGEGISPSVRRDALANLAQVTGMVMAMSVLYSMLMGDDEDYQNTEVGVRNRLLMIPGTGVSIPLRPDIFLLPKIAAEMATQYVSDNGTMDGTKARKAMADAAWNSVLGPTPVPQVVKPFVEVALNRNFFTGRDIIGTYMKNLETERQYTAATSELGKWLGSSGLIAPVNADHLVRGVAGSVGGLMMWASNSIVSGRPSQSEWDSMASLPGFGQFMRKEYGTGLKGDFYELRKEVDQVVDTYNDLINRDPMKANEYVMDPERLKLYGMQSAVNKVNKHLSELREAMNFVSEDQTMTASEKRERIKELREIELQLMKNVDVGYLRRLAGL